MKTGNRHKATGKSKKAKVLGFALCALLFALSFPAQAQQPAVNIPRIGIVRGDINAPAPSIKIFQQALQELGYVEGKISSLSIATPREVGTKP